MKRRSLLWIAAAAALVLGGCGQIEDSESDTHGAANTAASQEDTSAAETSAPGETAVSGTTAVPEETSVLTTTSAVTTTVTTTVSGMSATTSPVTTAKTITGSLQSGEDYLIPGIRLGMTEDEVSVLYNTYDVRMEHDYKGTYSLCTDIENQPYLGVDLKGYRFFEFESKNNTLIGYGYNFGCIDVNNDVSKESYPYSGDELVKVYDSVLYPKLEKWYGPLEEIYDYADSGFLRYIDTTLPDDSVLWFVCGENLYSENSGINELLISISYGKSFY